MSANGPKRRLREGVDEDVLGDGEVAEEVEFLMDEGDPVGGRVGRAPRGVGQPGQAHLAAVRTDDAADDIHQRALAGAVLSDQAEDASRLQRESYLADRMDAGRRPRDTATSSSAGSVIRRPRALGCGCARHRVPPRAG